jgi:hypothetical protein
MKVKTFLEHSSHREGEINFDVLEKLLVYNRRLFKKFSDVELYDDNRFNNYMIRVMMI